MELIAGYKKTEIGLIPSDWELKTLGDVGDVKMCRRVFNSETLSNGSIPFYKIGTFGKEADAYISNELYNEYRQRFSFPRKGDILISAAGTIGRTIIYNGQDAYFQDSNIVWIENNQSIISNDYLYYTLQVVKYNTEGGTIQRLYNSILKATKFLCPPTKAEQTAIANALSDADALIDSLEKLIAKKRNIKQGAMQKLLQPKEGWEVKKLGEIVEIVGGGTPSSFIPSYWNGTINWFTPTEIGKNKFTFESVRKITKEGFLNCSGKMLPAGTILLTTRAGIGDLSILMSEGCTNQGFQSLITKDGYCNEYLYYLMQTLKNVLIQNASGSTFLEISPNKIKQIEILIPSKTEQTTISTILSDIDAEITILETKLEKYKKVKLGMMQNLLTGKIRLI
ncbi:MAG: type I restriction enzyme S subunit [Rickettsiales bacterium]|jgi:type I restriction enzyme S subunit